MPLLDLEAEYNNRARVPEHPAILARWAKACEETRAALDGRMDIAYGHGPRQRYDLLYAKGADPMKRPLAVYIHGGYWQSRDRKDFAFAARALADKGLVVALPSYTLCPAVSVADIIAEMQQFLGALWQTMKRRAVVVGHSAGGHLAGALLATDWTRFADLPKDLARAGYSLSGLFELEPLVATSINTALKLTPAEARDASPLFWQAPPRDRHFVAAAGGAESAEFLRQSVDIAAAWSAAGVKAECVVVPGANHFTIVDDLANPESAMVARIVAMAAAVS